LAAAARVSASGGGAVRVRALVASASGNMTELGRVLVHRKYQPAV
jgi:hypothetical protein